ncbi:MAG TPA: hypothetical protein VGA04_23160 [Streptosporangiaceae bacterium]
MALDFDPSVVGISSQPFCLFWTTVEGRVRSHVPDYFARRADGSAVVVDCRPVERRPDTWSRSTRRVGRASWSVGSIGWLVPRT